MAALAIRSGIAVSAWLAEPAEILEAALDVLAEDTED